MDLSETYQGLSSFWRTIAPIIIAHVAALAMMRLSFAGSWTPLTSFQAFLQSDRYAVWKEILTEFDLKKKLVYLVTLAAIIYLVVFSSFVTLLDNLNAPYYAISWSPMDFFNENRPVDTIAEILSYSGQQEPRFAQITTVHKRLIRQVKAQYPDIYQSYAGWQIDRYTSWQLYYKLALILAFCWVLLTGLKLKQRQVWIVLRLFMFLILIFLFAGVARIQAEHYLERAFRSELNLLAEQFKFDSEMAQRKLPDAALARLKISVYLELEDADAEATPDHFWFSRFLAENVIPSDLWELPREFKRLSDEQFSDKYQGSMLGWLSQQQDQPVDEIMPVLKNVIRDSRSPGVRLKAVDVFGGFGPAAREHVGFLIVRLGKESNQGVISGIYSTLREITQQSFDNDRSTWENWWLEDQAKTAVSAGEERRSRQSTPACCVTDRRQHL